MKKIISLQDQIVSIIKNSQKAQEFDKDKNDLEYIDFHKSIEKMLTANSSGENK